MKPAAAVAHAVKIEDAEVRPAFDSRANRYDVVSRLADDLAHEIKNPLNAIVVNLEVLRRKIETGASQVAIERANVVDQEIARVHLLVDQLLQLMRPTRGEIRTISVDETLDELRPVLDAQAKAARVNLEMAADAGLFVRAAREVVKFAVLNLVVTIYDLGEKLQQIHIETRGTGDQAEILVKCTPGVFAEKNEFVQCARVWIEMAGGTLEIAELSAENVGSTTILRIPACSSFA
jgi:two-component system, NtrC family, C4-dicarboxylate transport sensor histidine kinase DctB